MNLRFLLISVCLAVLTGCGGNKSCDEPQRYEEARGVDPVKVPGDLDNLQTHKELKIPEPSPRPPRPATAGCLASPPTFSN